MFITFFQLLLQHTRLNVDIPDIEYEQRRDIFQLCSWIDQKLIDMENETNFKEIYFERKGRNVKKLLEEAVPLSYLGLHLHRVRRTVNITCFTGNQPYDAQLEIAQPQYTEQIKVEVSITETNQSTLRRQALARDGFAYLNGGVRRQGQKIVFDPEMVDSEDESEEIMELAFQRFLAKIAHGYDDQTAILIYVNTYKRLSPRHRTDLIHRARLYLMRNQPIVYGIYFCYNANLGVDGFQNKLEHYQ